MNTEKKPGLLKRAWTWWRKPSRLALGTLLIIGFIGGIAFVVTFNTTMHATSTEQFCISCHEMKDNVYQEYIETAHFNNRSGVKATCPDCHLPQDFTHKMIRKVQASRELYAKVFGIVDTPLKFEEHRKVMAEREWARLKATNSQECRNCHNFDNMDFTAQKTVAAKMHEKAITDGQTCIDCHKGIAHKLPDMSDVKPGF
ncbi:cytochrome c-type protein NapC [Plesiomonas sp.]|jgi:cytochrome c-type protein NapC|uniref:cytochrome c-type protein NapC n=1 Tax=Plesiomonas sp. TaxID=2486279 RepID=UPI003F38A6C5